MGKSSQGIFDFVGEFGDESAEKLTQGERVLELLRKFSPRGLEYQEIDRYLNVGKSLYTVLDRLEDRQLITKRRSLTDARIWVYCLPSHTTDKANTTKEIDSTHLDTPPPSQFSGGVELVDENATGKELEVSQQPENVDLTQNNYNLYGEIDAVPQEFIQHLTKERGERGVVEQTQFDSVLQADQNTNSFSTYLDTSSPTNFPTSAQKSFQQKYQPVEVLSSEGEWISGYFVHKCLVVANLAGIVRKWALVDELGAKYVFWGEIRMPRVK